MDDVPRSLIGSLVVLAAMLTAWGVSLLARTAFDQPVDMLVLAVALSISVGRVEFDQPSAPRWLAVAVVGPAAAAASVAGVWASAGRIEGDACLTAVLSAAVALRRFGPLWSRVGTLVSIPFVAALITPCTPQDGPACAGWSGLIGLLSAAVAVAWAAVGARMGPPSHPTPGPTPGPTPPARAAGRWHPAPSTRMALQMAAAVGLGFVVGRHVHPEHWPWPVLTAYLVGSGNRGRGDVIHKSLQRGVGAVAGTLAASLPADGFGAGNGAAIPVVFAVLWLGVLLRYRNYAYWAACVTGALALVYGYVGDGGILVLEQRIEGIGLGALAGAAAAWFLLPIRSGDVLRRRTGELLQAVTTLTAALRERSGAESELRRVVLATHAAARASEPFVARAALRRLVHVGDRTAGLSTALARCGTSGRRLAALARRDPPVACTDRADAAQHVLGSNLGRARRALRDPDQAPADPLPGADEEYVRELHRLDRAVGEIRSATAALVTRPGAAR